MQQHGKQSGGYPWSALSVQIIQKNPKTTYWDQKFNKFCNPLTYNVLILYSNLELILISECEHKSRFSVIEITIKKLYSFCYIVIRFTI